MEVTQVSFGNIKSEVSSGDLVGFLEQRVGLVLKCKIKKGSEKIPTHAFVHFESPAAAKQACKMAARGRLIFLGATLTARMDERVGQRGYNSLKSPANITLLNVRLEIGSMISPHNFLTSWKGPDQDLYIRIEPDVKRMRIFYKQRIEPDVGGSGGNVSGGEGVLCDLMLEIRVSEVRVVKEIEPSVYDDSSLNLELLIQLWSPPSIYHRSAEDDVSENYPGSDQLVDDEDPWIRSLDVITPAKSIGRCLDYRIRVQPRQRSAFRSALDYFSRQGLMPHKKVHLQLLPVRETTTGPKNLQFLRSVQYFSTLPDKKGIEFDIMFLVNALVHHDIVHDSSLTPDFFNLLKPRTTPYYVVTHALRHMLSSYKRKVFDATKALKSIIERVSTSKFRPLELNVTEGNMIVRRVIITPTRALCMPPEIELSNRVLRHYSSLADRFLRVSFTDENLQMIGSGALCVQVSPIVRQMTGSGVSLRTALYRRVVSVMRNGFWLCGRLYMFLAFSPNQLRDASAWFFAVGNGVEVEDIRGWMGIFPAGNVAKYAARMGQCFSSTYSTLKVQPDEIVQIPDVKRNNYVFSDGCGKISPTFAPEVAKWLKLEANPPSAYQIRYAGYKGVVGVWHMNEGPQLKLALRESMKKFISTHCQLEIVSWARFLPCFLNRQIITLLSTLNVSDEVFIQLQDTMVDVLNQMVDNSHLAYSVLMTTCAGEMYNTPLRMLCAGFGPRDEPHLRAMLLAIRAGQMEELIQKAKIFVPKGRWLLGCLDETGLLQYGQCFVQVSSPPKVDIYGKSYSTPSVITGKVVMTKNPCMHPGDIRVLEAVDVPHLRHMVDCLVFPQNGPRPHPNEASGSDLDGDVYFVSWDERLVPPGGSSFEPMEYDAHPAKMLKYAVRTEHVVEFFAKHMVNDSLGRICNAHVVHADLSEKGALDEDCLFLAKEAAKAVDYPKTGNPATMPHDLKPKQYPDFMGKDDAKTYKSRKVLGVLYRKLQYTIPKLEDLAIDFHPPSSGLPTYDSDLEVSGFEEFVDEAWGHKQMYDQKLRAIMTQFNITEEGQVVTGHVVLGKRSTARRFGDVKERVKLAYTNLHKEYLNLINRPSATGQQGQDEETDAQLLLERNKLHREYLQAKASAWYHVTYYPKWYKKERESRNQNLDDDLSQPNLLSFGWVGVEHLVLIKTSKSRTAVSSTKS
ncbi:hypothetical protein R1sor_021688 [Riccia sorocarpa]|uniref:RNA-dependent RNA polymerase n=1 Tax=Riccia sorocarpa TaxID=122646 RepID=A0ABD3GJN4_9MARC